MHMDLAPTLPHRSTVVPFRAPDKPFRARCYLEHPACVMMAGSLQFATVAANQCVREGSHHHPKWPSMPLCCLHMDLLTNFIHRLDAAVDENHHAKIREMQEANALHLEKLKTG